MCRGEEEEVAGEGGDEGGGEEEGKEGEAEHDDGGAEGVEEGWLGGVGG